MREKSQQGQRKSRSAGSGQEIDQVVVNPAELLKSCSEQAVEKQAKDATRATDPKDWSVAAQDERPQGGHNACRSHSGQRSGQAYRSICAGTGLAHRRDQARTATEHLANLRGDRVRRRFSKRRQGSGKQGQGG